jgi:hypothetical protein
MFWKKGKVKKSLQIRQRQLGVVENCIVAWLDSTISSSNEDYRNSVTQLQRIINSIKTFTDITGCINFLRQINDRKIFMIVSGYLVEQIASIVENFSHLDSNQNINYALVNIEKSKMFLLKLNPFVNCYNMIYDNVIII